MTYQDSLQPANLKAMLTLQDELNRVINPNWVSAKQPFLRAAFVEAAEALDHHGWKWWKNQSPNFYQLQIELIDILHFYLSDALVESNANLDLSINNISTELQITNIIFDEVEYKLDKLDILQLLELLGAMAACRRRSFAVLDQLMKRCSLRWHDAFLHYVSKNILNLFRQANGYRDGSYIKIWDGEEDNVWLERIAKDISPEESDYPTRLRKKLTERYLKIKGGSSS
jgi:dimeric dUTPase (all-alpha-NTP-PPase superfamily)